MTSTAVRVGLRARPLTQKERLSNCTECVSYIPNEPQILIGTDKSFTYDYVFDSNTDQASVYSTAALPLVQKFMEGFNATILAYGQTGSGKTYSMGTGLEHTNNPDHEGIVPRCIVDLFDKLESRAQEETDFSYEIAVSFLELYNEELIDLLNPATSQKRKSNANTIANTTEVTIREDIAGNIYWSGVREEPCQDPEEVLGFLAKGSLCRTTGSTDMNTVSSRSHAIFSVILKQNQPDQDGSTKSLTSKFHFVDLAGSERLKRTNAQGDRAKEGIAINSGLLALGNVISALGDESRRSAHVPYRDSKLTRLLQDSLGGNSQTLMLACVSPADSNFMETLNTLKYANRARNIKNRVTINQDFAGNSIEINQLRSLVARLRMEITALRAEKTGDSFADSIQRDDHTIALKKENARLRERIDDLSANLIQATSERDTLIMERELDEFVTSPQQEHGNGDGSHDNATPSTKGNVHPIIAQYQKTIQDLNNELADTRDRLSFLEAMKPAMDIARANFSGTTTTTTTASRRPRKNPSASTSQRRKRHHRRRRGGANNGRMNPSTSLTTSNSNGTRSARSRHHKLKATASHATNKFQDLEEDEGFVNDVQDENIRQEVRDSIAKARDEIKKGMQVLELIKPLDDTAKAWEEELKMFEDEEHRLNMERQSSDEGHYSAAPSPVNDNGEDDDDYLLQELEHLAVPTWEDPVKLNQKQECDGKSETTTTEQSIDSKSSAFEQLQQQVDKSNPQMARMLHQIQSDIKVKQELVSHLEKSETEYAFMRRKFDDKIAYFQSQLAELQRERDEALDRTKSRFSTNKSNKADVALQQREKQQLIDIRHAYEAKMKHLLCEIQDLRRKYSQMTSTMQATRNQNETLLRSLRANVETLQVEKKRMVKRMKAEAERVREQMSTQERRIHQLQRLQAEANMAKQRLEREHENQKLILKKRSEEIMVNQAQLKQLVNVLKKAVREGGVLDERLLGRVSHIVGGSFAIVARRGGFGYSNNNNGRRRGAKRVNPIPVQVRATRKKELLDKALGQFIQGKQAVAEMEQLLVRRERLATEKVELLEERKQIYMAEKENADTTGEPMDTMAIELMDERIDLMSAEISYLSARIRALQSEAAGDDIGQSDENNNNHGGGTTTSRVEKHVTFADEIITDPQPTDEWADMDAFEEHYNVPSNAAPEVAYDVTVKLLKSLETDECRRITEALVDDIMSLRMNECNRQSMQQNLEKTVMDLRRTLIVMKRAAIATTVENERRIRKLEELRDGGVIDRSKSPIDVKIEEYINGGNTIFDKIYEDGIRGLINTTPEPGMEDDDDFIMNSNSSSGGGADVVTGGTSSGSSVVSSGTLSSSGGSSGSSHGNSSSGGERGSPKPPKSLRVNKTPVPGGGQRETTPSPDRFYNMIQKRLSWQQQRTGGSESPVPITMISPAEFARYTADRDSSTSSIRSNHLRRSSIQSDFSSSLNSWNNTSSSSSLHRKPRHRASLRELSQEGLFEQYPPPLPPSSPLANYSTQTRQQYRRQTVPMVEHRSMTPNSSGNVFDRLAQTPTRASRAKMSSQRHSSGSFEELRQRWDSIQQERVDSPAAVY